MKALYSLIESPFHPDLHHLYQQLGLAVERFVSARALHRAVQNRPPDFFVAEFVYGWGNNYAGANLSNLDVTLRMLQCRAPQAKVIVFLHPREDAHLDKLLALFPVHAVFRYPVDESALAAALQGAPSLTPDFASS